MSIANRLLKLAALVALDKVMNKERSEELVNLLGDWKSERDKAKALAEAKNLAANADAVTEAVGEVIGDSGAVTGEERAAIEFAVATGIASLDEPPSEKEIEKKLLPGSSKTYVVLSDDLRLTGGGLGRFFHFNWDGESVTVRDYLENRILHPEGTRRSDKSLDSAPLTMTALEVWNTSTVRVQSLDRYGLDFAITEQDRWRKVLTLLTESAGQLRGK